MNAYAPTRRDGPETNETAQIWIKDHPSPSLMKTTRVDGVRFNVDAALLTWIGERKVPLRVALRLLREAFFQFFLQELLAGLGLADHLDRAVAEPVFCTMRQLGARRRAASTASMRRSPARGHAVAATPSRRHAVAASRDDLHAIDARHARRRADTAAPK